MLSNEDYNILKLFRSKNVGPSTFMKLLKIFGDCETAIKNIDTYNKNGKTRLPITLASDSEIEKEIVGCSTIGAKIITYKNKDYPYLLSQIDAFPPVLTVLGNTKLFSKRCVSIVGSRNASSNGCNFARKIAKELGEAGFVVVSGFASGIDSSAHRGAIDTGTIAVLGGGVDDIYPKGNEDLYYEIKNKGLIISEIPFNSAPRAENFPARNRIVSGLSEGVIVIEAGARSGTIHTSRQALEQGRELMVAPGNPYDYRCEGSNKLIKDGANIITTIDDVLDILNDSTIKNIRNNKDCNLLLSDNNITKEDDFVINNDKNEEDIENFDFESELQSDELKSIKDLILSKLNYTPISIDLLSQDLKIPVNTINAEIIELELEDKISIENGLITIK